MNPEINRLYNGDCLELMKAWPDNIVDLVVTDPPYGIDYQSNMRTESPQFAKLEGDDSNKRFEMYPWIVRKMKDNATGVFFCSWKNFADDYQVLNSLLHIKNVLIWNKGGGGIGDLEHTLSTDYEMAIVGDKGRSKIRGKRDGSVWMAIKENPNFMVHPTQKPVAICSRAIETFSDPGALVFDPFAGSGTTLVAAERFNRSWIGIEIDPTYVQVANDRIAKERSQLQLNLLEVAV